MPKLIDPFEPEPFASIPTPKTVVRRSGETAYRRSLSNASTAVSIESAPVDYVENKKRGGLTRMTSSKSTTESDSSSLALSKTQSTSKKSFLERLVGGTGAW
jgi:arginyl-tRNA--protein-N-Asp/Glu arginylyltransferase